MASAGMQVIACITRLRNARLDACAAAAREVAAASTGSYAEPDLRDGWNTRREVEPSPGPRSLVGRGSFFGEAVEVLFEGERVALEVAFHLDADAVYGDGAEA